MRVPKNNSVSNIVDIMSIASTNTRLLDSRNPTNCRRNRDFIAVAHKIYNQFGPSVYWPNLSLRSSVIGALRKRGQWKRPARSTVLRLIVLPQILMSNYGRIGGL